MLFPGINGLRQSGLLEILIKKGTQSMPKSFGGPEGQILGGRQLGLIFFFYSIIIVGSLLVLVLEICKRRLGTLLFSGVRTTDKEELPMVVGTAWD